MRVTATAAQLRRYQETEADEAETEVTEAIVELANVEANGTLELRQAAADRVEAMRSRVRALATKRVIDARYGQTVELRTPHGSLVHGITGEFVRPATRRDVGDYEVAKRHGRDALLIAHTHNGETWEEPYVVLQTKVIEVRVGRG